MKQEAALTVSDLVNYGRLAADEYEMAACALANMLPPAEAAAGRPVLIAQTTRQAAALRRSAEIIEAIARLPAGMQLSLGLPVLEEVR